METDTRVQHNIVRILQRTIKRWSLKTLNNNDGFYILCGDSQQLLLSYDYNILHKITVVYGVGGGWK